MISARDFDHFLKTGFIEGLSPGTSMNVLLQKYDDDSWIVKETEVDGLIYGIIKVGFIEFHIYSEKISGISYRPDLLFPADDFEGVEMPWIYPGRSIAHIERMLSAGNISYRKYTISGPLDNYKTAGADLFALEDGDHTFIDTEGGVTFLFEENAEKDDLLVYKVCRYYKL